ESARKPTNRARRSCESEEEAGSHHKGAAMRFIPTKFHAPLDYIVGAALIAYSLITNYELGVWKLAPMAVHNLIDVAAGALLALSPWLFGFADDPANVWIWFVVVGLAAIFLGLTTKQSGSYSYRRSEHPVTG